MGEMFGKMTRRTFLGVAGTASLMMAACGSSSEGGGDTAAAFAGTVTGTYDMHIQGYDWGCGVDKITLNLDHALDSAAAEDFVVSEHKQTTDWGAEGMPVIEGDFDRVVSDVTVNGTTVELELACDPDNGSPILYTVSTGLNTWSDPYQLNISLAEGAALTVDGVAVESLEISPDAVNRTTSADEWTIGSYDASDGTSFKYAAWNPEEESKTLVVWLHGMGEGGTENTDPYVTILANKVVALSSDEFQETVGGAYVLAPQCPTYWMDVDGKKSNFNGGDIVAEAESYYTAAAEELIDSYAKQIGAEKVVLTGCSNGGYMTMVLSIHRPDAYAGVVPICEALRDELITDDDIAGLKDLPMYFVYSEDDTTVPPEKHEIPTIKRLQDSGKSADTLHVSTTEHVVEEVTFVDGRTDENQYMGHWSWIYFDNNQCECNDDGLGAWEFIAECVK